MLLVFSPLFCVLLKNNKKPVETDVVIMLFEAHWSCYNSWHVPHRCKPEKCWLVAFLRHQSREAQITVCTASDCRRCLKNKIILLCLTLLFRQYFWTHSIVTFVPAPRKCLLFWWRISLSGLQHCSECHLASPAEVSCCSRFLKLNNHRVQRVTNSGNDWALSTVQGTDLPISALAAVFFMLRGCINCNQVMRWWRQTARYLLVLSDGRGHYNDYFHYFIIFIQRLQTLLIRKAELATDGSWQGEAQPTCRAPASDYQSTFRNSFMFLKYKHPSWNKDNWEIGTRDSV